MKIRGSGYFAGLLQWVVLKKNAMRFTSLILLLLAAPSIFAQSFQQASTLPNGGGPVHVDFLTSTTGFAVQNTWAYKSTNGGQSWQTISQEQFGGAYTYTAACMPDSTHIYLGKNSGGRLRYTKNGTQWNELQVGINEGIRSIDFVDTTYGFMLLSGNSGSVNTVHMMRTRDGGSSWTDAFTFPTRGYDARLEVMSPGHLLAWYQTNVYCSTDSGKTWALSDSFDVSINRVRMYDAARGMLVGRTGLVAYTTDSGKTFSRIPLNVGYNITDFVFVGPAQALALTVSQNESTLRSTSDTGRTWTTLATGNFLNRIDYNSSNDVWFFGTNNNLFRLNTALLVLESEPVRPLYPNPATDFVVVPLPEQADALKVFDLQGRLVTQIRPTPGDQQLRLDIAHWPAGLYQLVVSGQANQHVQRFVKQ